MRLFFSAQLTAFFLATPFGIGWVADASFKYSTGLFWVFIILAFVQFCVMTAALYTATEKWKW